MEDDFISIIKESGLTEIAEDCDVLTNGNLNLQTNIDLEKSFKKIKKENYIEEITENKPINFQDIKSICFSICSIISENKLINLKQLFELVSKKNEQNKLENEKKQEIHFYVALEILKQVKIIEMNENETFNFRGFPEFRQNTYHFSKGEEQFHRSNIAKKLEYLKDLVLEKITYQKYYEKMEEKKISKNESVKFPFIVINSDKNSRVQMRTNPEKTASLFTFSERFEIHSDVEILEKMGFYQDISQIEDKELKRTIPENLIPLIRIEKK
ncbi:transcription factor dp [Anaeramoeba ignava]|uniref:Transcription factor dp n=1 Tax=Anaeramoeba ignava TaxID=1746090 RepID=A0A9Q0RI50_ANAIG|nr:transcription factor dp [Anaeramoeba ignava]